MKQSIPETKSSMTVPGPDADLCGVPCVHADAVASARSLLHDDEIYAGLAALFGALGDPTRSKIVHLLTHEELSTCDIAAALRISDPAVSQHLRVLRSLRLVKSRRQGKFVYYRLDDARVTMLIQIGMTHYDHNDTVAAADSVPLAAIEQD